MMKINVFYMIPLCVMQLSGMDLVESSPAEKTSLFIQGMQSSIREAKPIIIGNKSFNAADMAGLSPKQKEQLARISEPDYLTCLYGINNKILQDKSIICCIPKDSDYEALHAMPKHIIQNLEMSKLGKCTQTISQCLGGTALCCFVSCAFLTCIVGCIGLGDKCMTVFGVKSCVDGAILIPFVSASSGASFGIPAVCECINCMQHRCCADYEKCDFKQ